MLFHLYFFDLEFVVGFLFLFSLLLSCFDREKSVSINREESVERKRLNRKKKDYKGCFKGLGTGCE